MPSTHPVITLFNPVGVVPSNLISVYSQIMIENNGDLENRYSLARLISSLDSVNWINKRSMSVKEARLKQLLSDS